MFWLGSAEQGAQKRCHVVWKALVSSAHGNSTCFDAVPHVRAVQAGGTCGAGGEINARAKGWGCHRMRSPCSQPAKKRSWQYWVVCIGGLCVLITLWVGSCLFCKGLSMQSRGKGKAIDKQCESWGKRDI